MFSPEVLESLSLYICKPDLSEIKQTDKYAIVSFWNSGTRITSCSSEEEIVDTINSLIDDAGYNPWGVYFVDLLTGQKLDPMVTAVKLKANE
jgi:hypothetical protein